MNSTHARTLMLYRPRAAVRVNVDLTMLGCTAVLLVTGLALSALMVALGAVGGP